MVQEREEGEKPSPGKRTKEGFLKGGNMLAYTEEE